MDVRKWFCLHSNVDVLIKCGLFYIRMTKVVVQALLHSILIVVLESVWTLMH